MVMMKINMKKSKSRTETMKGDQTDRIKDKNKDR